MDVYEIVVRMMLSQIKITGDHPFRVLLRYSA